jgi:hypothetical protein
MLKAMPLLRLETATPTETEKTIGELERRLKERDQEIKAMRETMSTMQPLIKFVNSFNVPEELTRILDYLKDDFTYSKDDRLRPIRAEFSPYIQDKLDRIAKRKGITQAEPLERLVVEDLELLEKGEERRLEIAKAHGLPITREEYEEKKKKKLKRRRNARY